MIHKIKQIYKILLKKFSPQGWWPLTIKGIHPKHHVGEPKNERDRFEIIIGSILTQNTNWNNVEKALVNLNKEDLIDVNKISKRKKEKLAMLIKPSGYFNQKSERLILFSKYITKNYDGNLYNFFNFKFLNNNNEKLINKKNIKNETTNKNIIELRNELLTLKGIGPETADSIILYAAQKPSFVIDTYTKRIYKRVFGKESGYDELKKIFETNLKKDVNIFKEYHALLVELGKSYCKKNKPLCENCPIKHLCEYYKKSN